MQMVYQILSAYFKNDCADELTLNPVFNSILEKFDDIEKILRDIITSPLLLIKRMICTGQPQKIRSVML